MAAAARICEFGFPASECGFEKAAERIERVMPRIALVFDEGMQNCYAHRAAILRTIFEGSGEWRDVRKPPFGEERVNLDFGVDPRFYAAVDFQDESISKDDVAIALLGFQSGGSQIGMSLAPGLAEGPIV